MNMTMADVTKMPMMNHRHMWMWFHTTLEDTVLFKAWHITTASEMIGSCVGIFILGILFEGFKVLRLYIDRRTAKKKRNLAMAFRHYKHNLLSEIHALQTFLFALQTIVGYILMLVFMTFSVWLCLAVTMGMTVGYYLFNDRLIVDCKHSSAFDWNAVWIDSYSVSDCLIEVNYRDGYDENVFSFSERRIYSFQRVAARFNIRVVVLGFVGSCVAVLLLSHIVEAIHSLLSVSQFHSATYRACNANCFAHPTDDIVPSESFECTCVPKKTLAEESRKNGNFICGHRFHRLQTILYFLQLFGSYSLMLLVMSYNVPLVLCVIAGRTAAYFLFAPLTTFDEQDCGDCCG